jgi:hypothetical protein
VSRFAVTLSKSANTLSTLSCGDTKFLISFILSSWTVLSSWRFQSPRSASPFQTPFTDCWSAALTSHPSPFI